MKYTKQAITTAEQISILRQRGLIVEDESQAREALDVISYFRLADYWRYMEADHITHQFKPNCRFSEILDYYYFDKELKALLFSAIQTIEIAIRTKIIKHFTPTFGAFLVYGGKSCQQPRLLPLQPGAYPHRGEAFS